MGVEANEPQISLAHLARPGASRIIVPFFSATASGLEPPRPAAAAVRTTRSTVPGEPCTPGPTCSPTSRPPDSRPCSPSMSTSRSRPQARCQAFPSVPSVERNGTALWWGIYQRMIAAYRHPDPAAGRELMVKLIESLSAGVPRPLVEIAKLGRTLSKRAADVLAYFVRPGTSNGPTKSDQRPPGAPARLRPRLPQPHQLHRPIPTRDRRIQTPTTPCIGEEPLFLGVGQRYDGNRQPVILS